MKEMILCQSELPEGFSYPMSFLKVVKYNLVNLSPWQIKNRLWVVSRLDGLRQRYPTRVLIPFAARIDNDDIACFELGKGEEVQRVHDFASAGWEQRQTYPDFWAWFSFALEEFRNSDISWFDA